MSNQYRQELNKMASHRREYVPVMLNMLRLYGDMKGTGEIRNLIDEPWIAILLELIDLGYADEDVFTLEKSFGSVTALYYNGRYPLTDIGKIILNDISREIDAGKRKSVIMAILMVTAALLLVYLFW